MPSKRPLTGFNIRRTGCSCTKSICIIFNAIKTKERLRKYTTIKETAVPSLIDNRFIPIVVRNKRKYILLPSSKITFMVSFVKEAVLLKSQINTCINNKRKVYRNTITNNSDTTGKNHLILRFSRINT